MGMNVEFKVLQGNCNLSMAIEGLDTPSISLSRSCINSIGGRALLIQGEPRLNRGSAPNGPPKQLRLTEKEQDKQETILHSKDVDRRFWEKLY